MKKKSRSFPFSSFSCPRTFEKEMSKIFAQMPVCVATTQTLPENGFRMALPTTFGKIFLTKTAGVYRAFVNACPHQGRVLVEGEGPQKSSAISCKGHAWRFTLEGGHTHAPHFEGPCTSHLREVKLYEDDGFLFIAPPGANKSFRFISPFKGIEVEVAEELGSLFSGDYEYGGISDTSRAPIKANWKILFQVYEDVLHVRSIHPELRALVDPKSLTWKYGESASLQKVKVSKTLPSWDTSVGAYMAGVAEAAEGSDSLRSTIGDVIWFGTYDGATYERYPGVFILTRSAPRSSHETTQVVEFYFHKLLDSKTRDAFKEFYNQTAHEDNEGLAEPQHQGRLAETLYGEGSFSGALHPHLEEGTSHRYAWWEKVLEQGYQFCGF
jgi:phenylpropionate dioxygenase-like ring-hydroxylating dioxygenase large terminal subunit